MPERLAVWYHTRLCGAGLNEDFAVALMAEQMARLKRCGLAAAAEVYIAVTGGEGNPLLAAALAPNHARLIDHGPGSESHLPTVKSLREWLPAHPGYRVCYFHAKGVTHPGDGFNRQWRYCMESVILDGWQRCVLDLEAGADSVGAHWLTPERFGSQVRTPFWGGMFFWASAKFLLTLPAIKEKPSCRDDWFLSEGWIGMGPHRPKVIDYRPHWPSAIKCR